MIGICSSSWYPGRGSLVFLGSLLQTRQTQEMWKRRMLQSRTLNFSLQSNLLTPNYLALLHSVFSPDDTDSTTLQGGVREESYVDSKFGVEDANALHSEAQTRNRNVAEVLLRSKGKDWKRLSLWSKQATERRILTCCTYRPVSSCLEQFPRLDIMCPNFLYIYIDACPGGPTFHWFLMFASCTYLRTFSMTRIYLSLVVITRDRFLTLPICLGARPTLTHFGLSFSRLFSLVVLAHPLHSIFCWKKLLFRFYERLKLIFHNGGLLHTS